MGNLAHENKKKTFSFNEVHFFYCELHKKVQKIYSNIDHERSEFQVHLKMVKVFYFLKRN